MAKESPSCVYDSQFVQQSLRVVEEGRRLCSSEDACPESVRPTHPTPGLGRPAGLKSVQSGCECTLRFNKTTTTLLLDIMRYSHEREISRICRFYSQIKTCSMGMGRYLENLVCSREKCPYPWSTSRKPKTPYPWRTTGSAYWPQCAVQGGSPWVWAFLACATCSMGKGGSPLNKQNFRDNSHS